MKNQRKMSEEKFEVPTRLTRALNSLPVEDARRCLVRVYDFIMQKGDRNLFADIQANIEISVFGLAPDRRRSTYNMIDRYKIMVFVSNFLSFDVSDERMRDAMFNFVFLSANKDSPAYGQRISFLVTACQLCVQYPARKLLDCTATWLIQDLPTQLDGEMIVRNILEMFVFSGKPDLFKAVRKLKNTCVPFVVVLFFYSITEENFSNPSKVGPMVLMMGKWLVKAAGEIVDVMRKSKMMSSKFSLIKLPILVKYCCTNSVADESHHRFQIGVLNLVQCARKVFFPLNLGFIKEIDITKLEPIAAERFEECAYMLVNWALILREELSPEVLQKFSTRT